MASLERFVMTLWSLWHGRNEEFWETKLPSTSLIIQRANSSLVEWKQAQPAQVLGLPVAPSTDRVEHITWCDISQVHSNVMWTQVFVLRLA